MTITQAYILCGGLGTRLGSMVKDTPKPMLEVGGKPILQHTMELLKEHGFTNAILVAAYKADVVKEFFEERDWGIDVEVFVEPELLGTAGAMPLLKDRIDRDFAIIYGDVFLDFDIRTMADDHEKHDAIATFLTGPSTHPWDSNLIQTDDDDRITGFVKKDEPKDGVKNNGDRAVYMVSRRILEHIPEGKSNFMREVFPDALGASETMRVHHLDPGQFVRDMGKPERFGIVEKYLRDKNAIEQARENLKPIRHAFLDRDGVINKEVDLLKHPDELELLPGAAEAIKLLNDHGITTIVTTNQPVLARGLVDEETFEEITKKLKDELAKAGAKLDAYYYCPHHPETQWGEGVKKLRRGCDCRKPANGMLMQAREDLDLDLAACVMIGDSFRDIEAGKNAGVRTVFIDSGEGAITEDMDPDHTYDSLLDAAQAIVEGRLNP